MLNLQITFKRRSASFFVNPTMEIQVVEVLVWCVVLKLLYSFSTRAYRTFKKVGSPASACSFSVLAWVISGKKREENMLEWQTDLMLRSPTNTVVLNRPWGARTVLTANPENVEFMLKTRFDNYPKGSEFRAILGDLLGDGIFNSDGDAWRFQKKISATQFTSRSLNLFLVEILDSEVTDRLMPLLTEAARRHRVIDLQSVLQSFTFDNICRLAFGVDPACLGESSKHPCDFAQAFDTATELSALRAVDSSWKLKRLLNIGSERRLRRAVKAVDRFAHGVIRGRNSFKGADLLSRFMASGITSEKFLRDAVVSFVLAGRDSTAAALTWFFWLLSRHPHAENAIRAEAARLSDFSYDSLESMTYLHAALCETMRLYPPVPFDSKHAVHADVLPDGTAVKAGDRVTYHQFAMGRMPSIWGEDCLEFKPERWLDHAGDGDGGVNVGKFGCKYAVFQGGYRVCLGKDMAFIQMKYVAASVIRRFSLRPTNRHRTPKCVSALTARMIGGLPVLVDLL